MWITIHIVVKRQQLLQARLAPDGPACRVAIEAYLHSNSTCYGLSRADRCQRGRLCQALQP